VDAIVSRNNNIMCEECEEKVRSAVLFGSNGNRTAICLSCAKKGIVLLEDTNSSITTMGPPVEQRQPEDDGVYECSIREFENEYLVEIIKDSQTIRTYDERKSQYIAPQQVIEFACDKLKEFGVIATPLEFEIDQVSPFKATYAQKG